MENNNTLTGFMKENNRLLEKRKYKYSILKRF